MCVCVGIDYRHVCFTHSLVCMASVVQIGYSTRSQQFSDLLTSGYALVL